MVTPLHSIDQPLITEVPLTAEAREKLLYELFGEALPHLDELFVPNDDFYSAGPRRKQAKHMIKLLCNWLGIKPGYIGLEFEAAGGEVADGTRYTIYVESVTLRDEFELGGFLAYALTRYLIEERKQIHLIEVDQQAALLASASIIFGLGLAIVNGITPNYSWFGRLRNRHNTMLRNFPLPNYAQMLLHFLRKHRIDQTAYVYSLTPWALTRLKLKKSKRPSHAVHDVRHRIAVTNRKLLAFSWLLVLVIGLAGFTYLQRVKPVSAQQTDAQQQVSLLNQLTQLCKDTVVYDRQYADPSDIQTIRALNAENLRCTSLQNQANAAQQRYQQLSGQ